MRPENKEKTILIVEDDLINARVFLKILSKRGGFGKVLHTENMEEVVHLAESGSVDMILMDVSLSRSVYQGKAVDGIWITRMLKSNPKTALIPILLVTAHAMEGDRENFLRDSNADGYKSKPIVDHQDFVDFVEENLYLDLADRLKRFVDRLVRNQKEYESSLSYYRKAINELNNKLKRATIESRQLTARLKKRKQRRQRGQKRQRKHQAIELDSMSSKEELSSSSTPSQQITNNQINESYRIVCADVIHSVRGEIMNIGSSNQEIRLLSNSSPEVIEECELIERSLKYTHIRLQKLADYFNLGKVQIETVELGKLIAEVESLFRPRLPSFISMEVQIQETLKKETILGNSDQLKSVLIELLTNSAKALQSLSSVSETTDKTIQVVAYNQDGAIYLSVKDNGPGVSEEVKDKLLKEVVKSDRGSGMGLYISSKVIQEMGGKLKLESSEEGTTSTLVFLKK